MANGYGYVLVTIIGLAGEFWCSSDLILVQRIDRKACNIDQNKYYYCIYIILKRIVDIY